MVSLLILVLLLQLAIHLINTLGSSAIASLLWTLYTRLPTPTSRATSEFRKLQREYLVVRKDLHATSSQDEFAKWAKLRRQHDKLLGELESRKTALEAGKASFERYAGGARWVATNGFKFFLQTWFARQPLFWLAPGWFPWYVEWVLAFPRAPTGSVSVQVWVMACASVVQLVSDAVARAYLLFASRRGGKVPVDMKKEEAVGGGVQTPHEKEL
ncbi:MAG: GET complex subunit get1 [Trizodia sp. TS-e1964]|nr:MAG: GET complex subunit get1 [Trizodia sp. TS-e1964]